MNEPTKRKTVTSQAVKNKYEAKQTARLNEIAKQFEYDSWRKLGVAVANGKACIVVKKEGE